MFASSSFLLSWSLVFLFAGAILYIIDRAFGRRVYRWWYDMTHEHPLDAEHQIGFIYGRKADARFFAAVAVTLVQGTIAIAHDESTLPNEVLSMLIEVPCLMAGFYVGPWLDRLWGGRSKVFTAVDQFESGERVLTDELQELSKKAVTTVVDSIHVAAEPAPASAEPKGDSRRGELQTAIEAKSEPAVEEAIDPKAYLNKYLTRD